MIKISFSGLSGSGKSSLLAEVKKILSLKFKVDVIEEDRKKNPFDSDKKSCFVSQFFMMSSQINEENKKAMATHDFVLSDSSVLDQWIAWRHYSSSREKTSQMAEKDEVMKTLYRFWIKTYDLIFMIRTDLKELEKRELNNEFRIADIDDIKVIEDLYKETLKEEKIKVIEIWNNNTIDESAHEILKHISEYHDQVTEKEKPAVPEPEAASQAQSPEYSRRDTLSEQDFEQLRDNSGNNIANTNIATDNIDTNYTDKNNIDDNPVTATAQTDGEKKESDG